MKSACIAVFTAILTVPAAGFCQDDESLDPSLGAGATAEAAQAETAAVDDYVGYIEWVSIRPGGGNYGGVFGVNAFTLRWRWFYWTILHISGGGGAPGGNDSFDDGYFGKAGTRLGVPIHFGPGGKHEIRLGVGISGGIIELHVYRYWYGETRDWYCTSHGPFLDAELLYEIHIKRRFAFLIGYEGTFAFNYVNDNGYPSDNWEVQNIHTGFVGLAF